MHQLYPSSGCRLESGPASPLLSLPSGAVLSFGNAEQHSWFNPELWQDVSSRVDLEPASRIFLLDEERVPCQYDHVIFQPETSFRVNLDSSRRVIPVQSISLMGQVMGSCWETILAPPCHGTTEVWRCTLMDLGLFPYWHSLCHQGAALLPHPERAPWAHSCLPALLLYQRIIDQRDNYRTAGSPLCCSPGR